MKKSDKDSLCIGWATADLTPDKPVLIAGQFHARVSEGVLDPITATAMAMEGKAGESGVMVSCELVSIPDELREGVRARLKKLLPELDPLRVFLNATHTHTAPEVRTGAGLLPVTGGNVPPAAGVELKAMAPANYMKIAVERIAHAVVKAWKSRAPAGIGFGLGFAVVGHNRRISYYNGETRMYGTTNDPEFSHIEGYEDHTVNVMGVWDKKRRLTGLVVNVACPAQVSENLFQISADYWHETRKELRRRFGKNLFILPQCSAAGDQSPHLPGNPERSPSRVPGKEHAEVRMWRLSGRTQRQDLAVRIADAVMAVLPFMEKEIVWNAPFAHKVKTIELSRRKLCRQDVDEALAEAAKLREQYEKLKQELEAHPEKRKEPRWYTGITAAFRRMKWYEGVAERFELEKMQSTVSYEYHVLRLGDLAIATNPFEYYLDYGLQIKTRSRAVQTFLVQLAGSGTYLPSSRAVAGKSYGAVPASTPIGPEGGRQMVEATLKTIEDLWPAAAAETQSCPEWAKVKTPDWVKPYLGRFGMPSPWCERPQPLATTVAGVDFYQANQFVAYRPETADYLYKDYTPLKVRYVKGTFPTYEKVAKEYTKGLKTNTEKAVALATRAVVACAPHCTLPPLSPRCPTNRALDDEALLKSGSAWCNEQARIFIRLCQVMDIPARMIQLFYSDRKTGHCISEFYSDGAWHMADASWYRVFPGPGKKLMSAAECHTEKNKPHIAKAYRAQYEKLLKMTDEELVGASVPDMNDVHQREAKIAEVASGVRKNLRDRIAGDPGAELWAFGIINYPLPTDRA